VLFLISTFMSVKFLVAEDEPWVARTIRKALTPHGFVEVVETAKEASERLASRSYDALVADVGLPDGSGFDLVAQAVSDEDGVLALLVSGRVDAERLAEAHTLGVPYLLKPIDTSQLRLFAARVRRSQRPESRRGQIDRVVDEWTGRYGLSAAQDQLLRMSAHGVSRADLAVERDVLPSTIKKQAQEILRRTGDLTLDAAVARLLREAVLPPHR
jgi:DNA-binding response OmpR family regulator